MVQTKFLTSTVLFSGGDNSTLTGLTEVTFPTNIIDISATIQSWKIKTSSDREIRTFNMDIDNIQKNGTQASCKITLTLASSDPKWTLDSDNCSVDVLFLATCE